MDTYTAAQLAFLFYPTKAIGNRYLSRQHSDRFMAIGVVFLMLILSTDK